MSVALVHLQLEVPFPHVISQLYSHVSSFVQCPILFQLSNKKNQKQWDVSIK